MWRQFSIALSFLTIFRLPFSGEISLGDSGKFYAYFPAVGLLIGLMTSLLVFLLHAVMPPLLLAAWACAFMTLVTRGFHLDGLADLADGLGGGYTPERRLQIMKDSATGAFGATAIVLAILLKTCAIYSLITEGRFIALAIVPALSRFAIVLSAYKSPFARPRGLAKTSVEHLTCGTVLAAASFAILSSMLLLHESALPLLATAAITSLLLKSLAQRLLGGITGDVLGAANEVAEVMLFTLSACLSCR